MLVARAILAALGEVLCPHISPWLLHPLGESDPLLGSSLESLPAQMCSRPQLLQLSPPDSRTVLLLCLPIIPNARFKPVGPPLPATPLCAVSFPSL